MLGPKGESYHPCVRRTVESPRCGSSRSALRVEELGVTNDVRHPLCEEFGLTVSESDSVALRSVGLEC